MNHILFEEEDDDSQQFEDEMSLLDDWEDLETLERDYEEDFEDSPELAETLREVLHDRYQGAAPEELEEVLFDVLESMGPAEGFNFGNVLRQIGTAGEKVLKDPTVGQIAGTVLPVAGTAIGTIYGGPVGAAIGGKLGQTAAQAFSGAPKPAGGTAGTKPAPVSTPPGSIRSNGSAPGAPTSPMSGGSPAAAQLLQLTQNPDVLKSLLALALGPHGQSAVPVGTTGSPVPVGAFMNLLNTLSAKAAADAEALLSDSENQSSYLLDSEGVFQVDPAVPEDRAQALYETLISSEEERLFPEDAAKPWSDFFPFGKATKLLIEYETRIRDLDVGQGNVVERSSNLLKLEIHIDKSGMFNVPETNATIELEYRNEGSGNRANIVVNGSKFTDKNVTIRSKANAREISMSITIFGQTVDKITLSRQSSSKAKLKFKAGGDEHVLILTKK